MKLIIKNLVGALIILLSVCSQAENEQKHKTDSIVTPTKASAKSSSVNSLEVDQLQLLNTKVEDEQKIRLLQSQLEMQKDFNEKILSTVYWFLGTTTALFALMLGVGWFGNYRDNKRHQEILKAHVEEVLSIKITEIEKFVEEKEKERFEKIELKIDENGKADKERHNSLNERIKSSVAEYEIRFYLLEFDKWVAQNVPTNALRAAISALNRSLEINGWRTPKLLDMIHDLFKRSKGQIIKLMPDADMSGELMTTLNKLPEKHSVMRDAIISSLAELKK